MPLISAPTLHFFNSLCTANQIKKSTCLLITKCPNYETDETKNDLISQCLEEFTKISNNIKENENLKNAIEFFKAEKINLFPLIDLNNINKEFNLSFK